MRVLRWLGAAVAVTAAAAAGYLYLALPRMQPPPDIHVRATPDLTAEGRYLVETVMACTSCHGVRDISRYAQPVIAGTGGGGGRVWNHEIGFPGTVISPNITPYALSSWSDGEIARAIADGVSRDGRPLFPLMGYPHYRHLCQADLDRILAYLRSMPAIAADRPIARLDFPLNLLMRTFPRPTQRPSCPSADDPVARGRYLTEIASCSTCHTREENGRPIEGIAFAGGFEFPFHDGYGTAVSANITPDATGIGAWTEAAFVARFKAFAGDPAPVARGEPQTEMPWTSFAGMRDEDLRAIYAYLRTVRPVENRVVKFLPPQVAGRGRTNAAEVTSRGAAASVIAPDHE